MAAVINRSRYFSRKRAIPLDVGDLSKPCTGHLSCKSSYREDDALLYESPDADSDESNLGTEEAENREDGDVLMDECSAALVLMSLGASPGYKAYDLHGKCGLAGNGFIDTHSPWKSIK